MSESDSFIQEVSEEVRRDAMFSAWRKYGPFVIAAVVIAVVGAAGKGWWDSSIATQKGELGGTMIAADVIEDPAEQATAFADVAASGEYGYPVLARIRQAAALAQAGELDAAVEAYEMVNASADADIRFRDLAELRILMLRSGTMPAPEMLARISPLTEEGSAWRAPALEFEAAAFLRNDEPSRAVESLRELLDLPNVLPTIAGRAQELIDAISATLPEASATGSEADTPSATAQDDVAQDGTEQEEKTE